MSASPSSRCGGQSLGTFLKLVRRDDERLVLAPDRRLGPGLAGIVLHAGTFGEQIGDLGRGCSDLGGPARDIGGFAITVFDKGLDRLDVLAQALHRLLAHFDHGATSGETGVPRYCM